MPSPAPMVSPLPPTTPYNHHNYQPQQHGTTFSAQFAAAHHQNMIANNAHHQHMYNQMMYNQRFNAAVGYPNASNPVNGGYPQHICGHFASMHVPLPNLQMPCPSCQGRSSMGMGVSDNTAYSGSWQVNNMGMMSSHYPPYPANQMSMSQSFNNYIGYNNQMMPGFNSQVLNTRDVQCGDVSQSTTITKDTKSNTQPNNTTSPAVQSGKPKSQKQHNNERISSNKSSNQCNNNNNTPIVNNTESPLIKAKEEVN